MDTRLSKCMGSVVMCDSVWCGVTISHSFEVNQINRMTISRYISSTLSL